MVTTEQRFWSKIDKQPGLGPKGDCWHWMAARTKFGHGVFTEPPRRYIQSHRFMWKLKHGSIPEGAHILHRCDNPRCVKPDHLFIGDAIENMKDRMRKGRYATGKNAWSPNNLDKVARGERHGSRTHPEKVARGERNGNSKLDADKVDWIRSEIKRGRTHRSIAEEIGVHRATVTSVNRGRNWKDAINPRIEVILEAAKF